jgi:hypothetical protein
MRERLKKNDVSKWAIDSRHPVMRMSFFVPITEGGRTGVSQIKNQQNLASAGEQSDKDVGYCSTVANVFGCFYSMLWLREHAWVMAEA